MILITKQENDGAYSKNIISRNIKEIRELSTYYVRKMSEG